MWISPEFKIYIVKEFQRLKEAEQSQLVWSAKLELAKINYRIHTDAIKQNLIPPELTPQQKSFVYADEGRSLSRTYRVFASKNSHKNIPQVYEVSLVSNRRLRPIQQMQVLESIESRKLLVEEKK